MNAVVNHILPLLREFKYEEGGKKKRSAELQALA